MDSFSRPQKSLSVSEDIWHRFVRLQVLRAPCLLPFLSVAGASVGGQGWALPIISVSCAYFLGMKRMLLMCLFCSLLVLLRTTHHGNMSEDLAARAYRDGYVTVEGTVVRAMQNACVVDAGWNKPSVLLRGEFPFRCGDIVQAVACYRETPQPLYPGMFDASQWLRGLGVAAEVDFIRGEVTGHPVSWASLCGYASDCRSALERRFMPPGTESDPRRQFLCALVLGDKQHASPELLQDFRRSGCLHIFAVSGLHVGVVAGLLYLFLRLLRINPVWARWLVLVLPGGYVLLTGLALPALRAYLMLVLILGGAILQRRVGLLNIWCFAGAVLLLVSPWQVGQSSFLLSFAMYGAICVGWRFCLTDRPWFGPDAYIPFRIMTLQEKRFKAVESWLRGIVMVAVIAWIASLPLTLHFFHSFNLYGILTNIAVSPLLPLVMGAALLSLCFAWVPWLGGALGWLSLKGAGVLLSAVAFFSKLPCAYLPAEPPRPAQEAVVVSLGGGNSSCLLGNNGLLIDCGSGQAARFTLQPLLFHMGFTPGALLVTSSLKSRCGGKAEILSWRRDLPCLPCGKTGVSLSWKSSAGVFRIYYPPKDLPSSPAANMSPVVTWRSGNGLLVYVGDASLATLEQVTEDLSSASVLILGNNPGQIADADTLRARMPAARVILLPSATRAGVREADFAPAELVPVKDAPSYYLFRLEH